MNVNILNEIKRKASSALRSNDGRVAQVWVEDLVDYRRDWPEEYQEAQKWFSEQKWGA